MSITVKLIPVIDEDPIEVADHNLKVADYLKDYKLFAYAKYGYFKNFPTHTHQDLETYLRKNKFSTYLIAKDPPPNMTNYKIDIENCKSDVEYKYVCIMYCKPYKFVLEELFKNGLSYNSNFEALRYAGDVTLFGGLPFEDTPLKWISENKMKLEF